MATVHQFRRLRHGPPRRLPTPDVLRVPRRRLPRLRQTYGLLALALLMLAGASRFGLREEQALPRPLAGVYVRAVDGDSLRAGGEDIRLLDIDAPELRQTCRDEAGREWPCGRAAHVQLQALLQRGGLRCKSGSRDVYGRTLATCSAGGVADIGEALVRAGFAVDTSRAFLGGYAAAEAEARAARRGIWRGSFERSREWRRRHPRRG